MLLQGIRDDYGEAATKAEVQRCCWCDKKHADA